MAPDGNSLDMLFPFPFANWIHKRLLHSQATGQLTLTDNNKKRIPEFGGEQGTSNAGVTRRVASLSELCQTLYGLFNERGSTF